MKNLKAITWVSFIFILLSLQAAEGGVFAAKDECELQSGRTCKYQMCDYIPPGKIIEEVCGAGYKKGWTPIEIRTREECEQLKGRWARYGEANNKQCSLPTTDAGKICKDSSDCQGECVASNH